MKSYRNLFVFGLAVLFMASGCKVGNSPFGPEAPDLSNTAVLKGIINGNGSHLFNLNQIVIRLQNTDLTVNPDSNGYFSIDGVLQGDAVLSIDVLGTLSTIPIANILPNEEIGLQLDVQENKTIILNDIKINTPN